MGVVEGLADNRHAFLDRDDRDDARLGQRRIVVDRGDLGPEPRGMEHDRGQQAGQATSIVNCVSPRILSGASTRSRPSRPISL